MNATQRAGLLQRWSVVQAELILQLGLEIEALTPRLMKLIHTLEWVRIEEFVPAWHGIGRPPGTGLGVRPQTAAHWRTGSLPKRYSA